ncbi:MAG: NAD-dependent epimerase/dehydratase family protein [Victivallaceae bacterium]|nr:NAD-dependent epimerase/dehydratase family protein [Victivallaceae bacterium]
MKPIRTAITGNRGFIGGHLFGRLRCDRRFEPVAIERRDFESAERLAAALDGCSAVVHLAGLSRHEDGAWLYHVNMELAEKLNAALNALPSGRRPALFFGSTTHIAKETPYHASKRDAQTLFEHSGFDVTTLLMPNVFGPYSRPFFNSVVATFCKMAADGATPERIDDAELKLIDVFSLVNAIAEIIAGHTPSAAKAVVTAIPHRFELRLPELWRKLLAMSGRTPETETDTPEFDRLLRITLNSY